MKKITIMLYFYNLSQLNSYYTYYYFLCYQVVKTILFILHMVPDTHMQKSIQSSLNLLHSFSFFGWKSSHLNWAGREACLANALRGVGLGTSSNCPLPFAICHLTDLSSFIERFCRPRQLKLINEYRMRFPQIDIAAIIIDFAAVAFACCCYCSSGCCDSCCCCDRWCCWWSIADLASILAFVLFRLLLAVYRLRKC